MSFFSDLVQDAVAKIRNRSILVFLVIHAGLISAVYGLASIPHTGNEAIETSWRLLMGGVAGLYGGLLLGVFFVVWPMYSVVRRVRQLLRWREWILRELPQILALIPTVVATFRSAVRDPAASPSPSRPVAETVGAATSNEPPAA